MIRRSVYTEIGSYDPRLTNLQDFDMWVRLCTSHDIKIMRDELIAFRILANARNMSAPRRDSILRSQFETAQILRRFRSMNPDLLREIFHSDLMARGVSTESNHNRWLAELALMRNTPAHRVFALQSLYETAQSDFGLPPLAGFDGRHRSIWCSEHVAAIVLASNHPDLTGLRLRGRD